MPTLGTTLPAFALAAPTDKKFDSNDLTGSPVLFALICNHCPFVKHIAPALADFARDYQQTELKILTINSNDFANYPEESPARMQEEIAARSYKFPYLADEDQSVAKAFDAA